MLLECLNQALHWLALVRSSASGLSVLAYASSPDDGSASGGCGGERATAVIRVSAEGAETKG